MKMKAIRHLIIWKGHLVEEISIPLWSKLIRVGILSLIYVPWTDVDYNWDPWIPMMFFLSYMQGWELGRSYWRPYGHFSYNYIYRSIGSISVSNNLISLIYMWKGVFRGLIFTFRLKIRPRLLDFSNQ